VFLDEFVGTIVFKQNVGDKSVQESAFAATSFSDQRNESCAEIFSRAQIFREIFVKYFYFFLFFVLFLADDNSVLNCNVLLIFIHFLV
jgi:hypothetical protein